MRTFFSTPFWGNGDAAEILILTLAFYISAIKTANILLCILVKADYIHFQTFKRLHGFSQSAHFLTEVQKDSNFV